jgi:hypothetical protein
MTTTGSAGVAMACGYCGRPCASGVWIGHQVFHPVFHPECTRGPGFTQQHYVPPPLTEERVREIVRDEMKRGAA